MDVQLGPSAGQPAAGLYHNLDPSTAATGRAQANYLPPIAPRPDDAPAHSTSAIDYRDATPARKMRKRKADTQDNERLSKRLSLLNLEQNGQKLYVPVESPQLKPTAGSSLKQIPQNDQMQLDESKHKVYIYDLDAELSDGESSSDEGKLVFLPDIEKHLRLTRIPPRVLANSDGELAGMQLVLYSEPESLTVPKEQDSVRKAIIEARTRLRRRQKGEDVDSVPEPAPSSMDTDMTPERRIPNGLNNLANDPVPRLPITMPAPDDYGLPIPQYYPDAMEMDID